MSMRSKMFMSAWRYATSVAAAGSLLAACAADTYSEGSSEVAAQAPGLSLRDALATAGSPATEAAIEPEATALVSGGSTSGTEGGGCEVVAGPNKGKKGTYDGEGWCTGDWGGTECTTDGVSNGKCKDAARAKPDDVLNFDVANVAAPVWDSEPGSSEAQALSDTIINDKSCYKKCLWEDVRHPGSYAKCIKKCKPKASSVSGTVFLR